MSWSSLYSEANISSDNKNNSRPLRKSNARCRVTVHHNRSFSVNQSDIEWPVAVNVKNVDAVASRRNMKLALWEERSLLSANTTKQSKKRMNTCHRVSSNFKCIYEVEWEHCLAPVNAFHLAQKRGGRRHLTQRNATSTYTLSQWCCINEEHERVWKVRQCKWTILQRCKLGQMTHLWQRWWTCM